MTVAQFNNEVIDLLITSGNFTPNDAAYIVATNSHTINGCIERELTPNDAYNLILTGTC